MGNYQSDAMPMNWGVTLNGLKDQLYSLNMRMLLALQNHDEEMQEDIKRQMAAVQAEIDRMCSAAGYRHEPKATSEEMSPPFSSSFGTLF